ncbi:MAG: hypothetical protein DME85_01145 [Verrucomicrobia bacterium]|nr:MAG: hypothetical protein DME85_01145 [Verrucomicrobiota bacterium]
MKFTKTRKSNKARTRLMLQVGESVEALPQQGHGWLRDRLVAKYPAFFAEVAEMRQARAEARLKRKERSKGSRV